MIRRKYAWLVLLLVITVLVVACGSEEEATQAPVAVEKAAEEPVEEVAEEPEETAEVEPPDLGTLKVGILPLQAFAPFFVAQEKGYFDEQGLDIEFETFRTGDAMIAPLSQGQLDIGGGETGPALFNGINLDLDVKVVAGLAQQAKGYGGAPLLVRSDLSESGEVVTPGDLEGMKVAVNVERGTAEYLVAKALEHDGLAIDDVELISIPFPEMPAALANDAVDAALLPFPLAGKALGAGDAVVLLGGDEITDTPQNGVMYFGQRLLDPANSEVGVRFLIAYLKATRELQNDTWRSDQEILDAILTYVNVPETALSEGTVYYFDANGGINRDSTADFQAYHVGRGYTELSEPLPLDEIIIPDFLDLALSRVGEYEG